MNSPTPYMTQATARELATVMAMADAFWQAGVEEAKNHADGKGYDGRRVGKARDDLTEAVIRILLGWEMVAYTHQREIDWARANPGRAGSLYSVPDGPSDIALYAKRIVELAEIGAKKCL